MDRVFDPIDHTPDIVYTHDLSGNLTAANRAALSVCGYSRQEALGLNIAQMVDPEYVATAQQMLHRKLGGEAVPPYELLLVTKTGERVPIEVNTRLLFEGGRPVGVQGIGRDITERKRAEKALRESEAKFRAVAETATCAICISSGRRLLYVNPAAATLSGFSREELLGMNSFELIAPADRERAYEMARSRVRGDAPTRYEMQAVTKQGETRWHDISVREIEYDGKPAILSTAFDITERKRAEQALSASEARYRQLFENVPDGVFQTAPDGRILAANPALVNLLGFESAEELRAIDITTTYVHPEDRAAAIARLEREGRLVNLEINLRRRDGREIVALENTRCCRDEQGNILHYEGTLTDITDRKRLEERLRHSEKMEAVGRLAGGIAHDFNNLLTVISGYSGLVRAKLAPGERAHVHIQEVEKAAQRAAQMVRQLLAFSRRQILTPVPLDLNALIADMENMLRRLIGEQVQLCMSYDSRLGAVRADQGQMQQIVMNLVVNARDAMPDGGVLTIETVHCEDPAGMGEALLRVRDTGTGMDAQTRSHLFEPYYTTKDIGKGTGLGLSTVYGIVEQSGGRITVDTAPSKGTLFEIWLPCCGPPPAPAPAAVETPASASPAHGARILIVEDQAGVRDLMRDVLSSAGYEVYEAGSGSSALAHCEEDGEAIDLLITDLVMPGMDGRTLAAALSSRFPALRVLFISGQTEGLEESSGMRFLRKPFPGEALLAAAEELLRR